MRTKNRESIDTFIDRRISSPERYQFLCQMQPFQFTSCLKCRDLLSRDNYNPRFRYDKNENGLCDDCEQSRMEDEQLEAYKEEERWSFARGPRGWW
jgi:hypothetical protein